MNTAFALHSDTPKPIKPSQPTALLVDDNWDNRVVGRMVLENAGYTVSEATNGCEALALLSEQVFDLMVLDLLMPIMNGQQVLEFLRGDDVFKEMPVIVTTACDDTVTDKIINLTPYILHRPLCVLDLMTLTFQFRTAMPA